jgi:hypothetical protein
MKGPPATDAALRKLRERFPMVPNEYLEFSKEATEVELEYQGHYLRIWHPDDCLEMDDAYDISARLPSAIPIGDDGGERVILYFDGNKGRGLYRVGYGDLDPGDAVWVAPSLYALLGEDSYIGNL